jgi:ribonuclease D
MEDLSALKPVFGNPAIEKVFHAAEYDLICLKRDFGFEIANLFDTMAASRILGYEAVGLGSMLEAHFGIKVDKRQQRANWGQRPLPAELLNYASLDTHYLIQLRNILKEKLNERGLWLLAEEDFQRMAALQAIEGNGGGEERVVDPWRINGAHDLRPQRAAV